MKKVEKIKATELLDTLNRMGYGDKSLREMRVILQDVAGTGKTKKSTLGEQMLALRKQMAEERPWSPKDEISIKGIPDSFNDYSKLCFVKDLASNLFLETWRTEEITDVVSAARAAVGSASTLWDELMKEFEEYLQ